MHEILFNYVQENYCLIERRSIFFGLLSEIVLEFSSENYSTIKKILASFKKRRILNAIESLNELYREVIGNFDSVDIAKISKEKATQLNERIRCAKKIMSQKLS